MISPLEDQPLSEVMGMLESIAKSNDLLLSINLIDFADDIYKIAYERGTKDERKACADIGDWFHDENANCGDLIRARGQA